MNESNIKGVSIRSILALVIVISCCAVAIKVKELGVLKDLAFLVLGFYFGQKPTGAAIAPALGPIAAPEAIAAPKTAIPAEVKTP